MTVPKLDVNFIKPFVLGVMETLKVQCSTETEVGKPFAKKEQATPQMDIAGILGIISGSFRGSISIGFTESTFLKIMSGMLKEELTVLTSDIQDGAGELLNIIFGYAKRELNSKGYSIELAIPTVIKGKDIKLKTVSKTPSVIVPFNSKAGDFFIEIGVDD